LELHVSVSFVSIVVSRRAAVQEARSQLSPVGFVCSLRPPVSRSSLGRISTKVRIFHLLPSIQSVRNFAYLGRVIVGSKTSEVVILGDES
jgi:hypothetical protein